MKSFPPRIIRRIQSSGFLFIIFFTLMLLLILIGVTFYFLQKREVKTETERHLLNIANLKARQLDSWRKERLGDASIIRNNQGIALQFDRFLQGKNNEASIQNWLQTICRQNGYETATFIDTSHQVRFKAGPMGESLSENSQSIINQSVEQRKIILSNFYFSDILNGPAMGLSIPIYLVKGTDSIFLGILYFRIDPSAILYPQLQSWPTPSESAEVILLEKEDHKALVLNELRFKPGSALTTRFTDSNLNQVSVKAIRGDTGTREGVDYRGVPVVSVITPVPESPWYLVAKVDKEEIFSTVLARTRFLWILIISLVLLTGIAISFWYRNQRENFHLRQLQVELERDQLSKKYELLVRHANDIILVVDPEGVIRDANNRAILAYGYTHEELIGMNAINLRSSDDKKTLPTDLKKVVEKNGAVLKLEHQRKDGSTFFVESSIRQIEVSGRKLFHAIIRDVTESQQARDALNHSLSLLEATFEATADGIFVEDKEGKNVRFNTRFATMWYLPDELANSSRVDEINEFILNQLKDPEEHQGLLKKVHPAIGVNTFDILECRDGRVFECHSHPQEVDEDVVGRVWSFHDVTASVRALEELKEKEQQNRDIITLSPVGFYQSDPDGQILATNQSLAEILGFRDETELLSTVTMNDLYLNPEERNNLISKFDIPGVGRVRNLEVHWRRKDGTLVPVLLTARAIKDEQGQTRQYEGFVIDITDLQNTRDRLDSLYRLSHMTQATEQEVIEYALEEALRLTGSEVGYFHFVAPDERTISQYTWSKEVIRECGIPIPERYIVDSKSLWAAPFRKQKPVICNDPDNYPERTNFPEGHPVIHRFLSIPVMENDKIVAIAGVGNKVSDYQETDAAHLSKYLHEVWRIVQKLRISVELKEAKQTAEASDKLKTALLLNISHELRTPMNGILGFSSILMNSLDNPEAKRLAALVNNSGHRLMNTLNMIIDFAQLVANLIPVSIQKRNISELTECITDSFRESCRRKQLHFSTVIPPRITGETDPQLFTKVLGNLIDNAIKFTDTGSVTVTLDVQRDDAGEWIVVGVEDTGIGISPENLEVILQEFRQVSEGYGRSYEGMGLGLPVCRKILELLQGDLVVSSRPGKGSVFTIRIPAALRTIQVQEEPILQPIPVPEAPTTTRWQVKQPHILIVEDNEVNLDLIEVYLKHLFTTNRALTGKVAIHQCEMNSYDAILMDINLGPDMDGLTAAKKIRAIPGKEQIPIIAVTGFTTIHEKNNILRNGCDHVLSKPFTKEELQEILGKVLGYDIPRK